MPIGGDMGGMYTEQMMADLKEKWIQDFKEKDENYPLNCSDCSDTGYQEFRGTKVPCTCVTETDAWQDLSLKLEKSEAEVKRLTEIIKLRGISI
jgi:hypothetical protein